MPQLLKKLLEKTESEHRERLLRIEEARRYYKNRDAICRTGAAAIAEVNGYLKKLGKNPLRSADNRISANWHRIITDQKTGYMFSYPPQLDIPASPDAARVLNETLGSRFGGVIKRLGEDAANCGAGWLAYWYERGGGFGFCAVSPEQLRPVWDNSLLEPKMKYLIRTVGLEDGSARCELWSGSDVTYYVTDRQGVYRRDGSMGDNGVIRHSYGSIPFVMFPNNAAREGDLGMYRPLIDAIDKLLSGFANDIDDMQEIIWVIKNYAGELSQTDYDSAGEPVTRDIDLLQKLKAKKLISVDGDGSVDTLRGEIPYEARGAFLDILMRQLFISAMAVDPFPQSIGQTSGVYIDFLYSLLELKAGLTETEFRPAISTLANAVLRWRRLPEREIEQVWTRNKPRDALETVSLMSQTPQGVLSRESMTRAHPLCENWRAERERIVQEEKENGKA